MYIESNALFLQKGLKDTVQGNSNYQSVLGRAKVTGVTEGQWEKMEKRKKRMSWRRTEAGIIPPPPIGVGCVMWRGWGWGKILGMEGGRRPVFEFRVIYLLCNAEPFA